MTLGIVVQHGDVSDSADGVLVVDAQGKIQIAYLRDLTVNFRGYARQLYGDSVPSEHHLSASLRAMVTRFQRSIEQLRSQYRYESGGIARLCRKQLALEPHQSAIVRVGDVANFFFKVDVSNSLEKLYYIHLVMMEDIGNFRSDPHSYVMLKTFLLHSETTSRDFELATKWSQSLSKEFNSFILKCRARITSKRTGRQMAAEPFNENDKILLNVCHQYVLTIRQVQISPYASIAATILQSTGMYTHLEEYDRGAILGFLDDITEKVEENHYLSDLQQTMKTLNIPPLAYVPKPKLQPRPVEDICAHIRHDFGHLPVYVIDDIDAQELDDGISIEEFGDDDPILHVHIANPSAFLPLDSEAFTYARRRSETVYRTEGTSPMLPQALFPQVRRVGLNGDSTGPQNVLTMSAQVRKDGSLGDVNVRCGIVRNVIATTYGEMDELLGQLREPWADRLPNRSLLRTQNWSPATSDNKKRRSRLISLRDIEILRSISNVTHRHAEHRARHGGFAYVAGRPDIEFGKDLSMKFADSSVSSSPSRRLVMNAAVIANSAAARFASDRNIPLLYRAQTNYISPYSQTDYENLLNNRIIDSSTGIQQLDVPLKHAFRFQKWIGQAVLTTIPLSHEMMGLLTKDGGYTRVTSPLRRFGDLIGHYQLTSYLLNGISKLSFNTLELQDMGHELMLKESLYSKIKNATSIALMAKFMERFFQHDVIGMNPNYIFDAIILSNERDAIPKAWIQALGLLATFPPRTVVPPAGETINCRVVSMKPLSRTIMAELAT